MPLFLSGFNTQPPEGGWLCGFLFFAFQAGFNTQPPEGGWNARLNLVADLSVVSTHSRPKAAGSDLRQFTQRADSFNTQPPEGGWCCNRQLFEIQPRFQHTAARRRLACNLQLGR